MPAPALAGRAQTKSHRRWQFKVGWKAPANVSARPGTSPFNAANARLVYEVSNARANDKFYAGRHRRRRKGVTGAARQAETERNGLPRWWTGMSFGFMALLQNTILASLQRLAAAIRWAGV